MDPIAHLAFATLIFLATHYVTSTPLREPLVETIGENVYLGAYSLVSFATIGWMIWAFYRAPFEPLWQIPGLRLWPLWIMPVSLVLIVCGVLSRNPTAVKQDVLLKSAAEPRGIIRITRHPVMWGIALWAAAHILARGDAASLIFYGGFLIMALTGPALIDARKADALGEDWKRFAALTSNVPFWAIVEGRNRFRPDEIGAWRLLAGLALYAALLVLHPFLFGPKPY